MGLLTSNSSAVVETEEMCIKAQIIRNIGQPNEYVEPERVVSYWHRNPIRRAVFKYTGKVFP